MLDIIYIAASSGDARFTRTCVASIRHFYPEIPVQLLAGGQLEVGLAHELKHYWNVGVADLPRGDYGWGFVKLEPLFRGPGERFLVLDSDTVFTGPVLNLAGQGDADFIVDAEDQPPERVREIYYDVAQAAAEGIHIEPPAFLFNTGQWFGTSGVLSREDFAPMVRWTFPRIADRPRIFKNGEQGVMNFVVNERSRAAKIRVSRVPLMLWPGHGMAGVNAGTIRSGTAPPRIIHWAGLKKRKHSDMVGADVLNYFENEYYACLPVARARRAIAGAHTLWSGIERRFRLRLT